MFNKKLRYLLTAFFALFILAMIFFYPLGRIVGGWLAHSDMGQVIAAYPDALAEQSRSRKGGYIAYGDVPGCLRQAIVSVEDKRFHTHSGIDPFAAVRVTIENLRDDGEDHGGSTITQQLARAILEVPRRQPHMFAEVTSRLAVMRGSLILEHYFSKEKILELYLTSIYFGKGATGIGAAAAAYFGKDLRELDRAECIYLAGLPQAPTTFGLDPDGDYARERFAHVVATMERNGYVSRDEAAAIEAEQLFATTTHSR
jgi:membrane peptidoglycan carboxypeptidase